MNQYPVARMSTGHGSLNAGDEVIVLYEVFDSKRDFERKYHVLRVLDKVTVDAPDYKMAFTDMTHSIPELENPGNG
jgi:hypothetical protein